MLLVLGGDGEGVRRLRARLFPSSELLCLRVAGGGDSESSRPRRTFLPADTSLLRRGGEADPLEDRSRFSLGGGDTDWLGERFLRGAGTGGESLGERFLGGGDGDIACRFFLDSRGGVLLADRCRLCGGGDARDRSRCV